MTKNKHGKNKKDDWKWGRPDKLEIFLLLTYGIFLYLFNDMVNMMSNSPLVFEATGHLLSSLEVPLIGIMWFSLLIFHIALFSLVSRSIWTRKSTHKLIDMVVGIWMFIGVFLIIIPTVAMLNGVQAYDSMSWFFGIGRITVYHVGLFLFQIPGMVYFALTK